jgi:SAM-dependent methyltransferase
MRSVINRSSITGHLFGQEEAMEEAREVFVPAAGRDWALPLYDPLVKLIGGDRARTALLDLAAPSEGQVVLDVGCGTGSLAVLVKHRHPGVEVVGLDPDPRALARARRKALRAGLQVRLDRAFAHALPYADASFDRVLSSFVYHHLERDAKEALLREARRVLKPGGRLLLLDFDGPETAAASSFARRFHRSRTLADNDETRILDSMRRAGFEDAKRVGRGSMVFGLAGYSCFAAVAPPAEAGAGHAGGRKATLLAHRA